MAEIRAKGWTSIVRPPANTTRTRAKGRDLERIARILLTITLASSFALFTAGTFVAVRHDTTSARRGTA